jgi:hypothetical protein
VYLRPVRTAEKNQEEVEVHTVNDVLITLKNIIKIMSSKFNEAKMQSIWTKHIKENKNKWKKSTVWELKITKKKRLPFRRLEDHQRESLAQASNGAGDYHKISDMSLGMKPWDCQLIKDADCYVVVLFYVPRKPKEYIVININNWMLFETTHNMKSLTKEDALSIADEVIIL